MPAEGLKLFSHDEILSFEQIVEFTRVAAGLGITKIKLTGGEPLVRHGITDLVAMLAEIDGIDDLGMTTNAVLLPKYARQLADAGLGRVNVSLDTTNPGRFSMLTRGGEIEKVFDGVTAAVEAGLTPIKLNCVAGTFTSRSDIDSVKEFADKNRLGFRVIRLMDFENGKFSIVHGGTGGDCKQCSRLRLTSNGFVRPCLFSDIAFDVNELGNEKAIKNAIEYKPQIGGPCSHKWMHGIGG
jgi:cyclic pyranopterin phosphate synthase